jgi:hypothetical protein
VCDFVWRQEIISIEPLNVISLAKLKGFIPGCGSTLVFLRDDGKIPGSELSSNCQRLVRRAIIDDDDFFPRPGLCQRGSNRVNDPSLGVICRYQNRN